MMDTIETDEDYVQYDDPATMIDLSSPRAMEAVDRLGRHVPADVDPGKPLAAMFDPHNYATRVLTTVGLFEVHSVHVERLLAIGDGDDEIAEWTSWCGGRETHRRARRTRDLRPQSAVE